MSGCTSPLFRVPFASSNFGVLVPRDQKRLKNHGVFLKREALEAYGQDPRWDPDQVQILRCGQCLACRLNYSRDWAIRCSLEASLHDFNYFVTLTYDDVHLPRGEFVDYSGEVFDSNLCRRDVQLFVKNFREYERKTFGNTGIKVFYCGEYGDLTKRPHYHLCLFGCSEIKDLTYFYQKGRQVHYKSATLERCWSTFVNSVPVLRGFVDVSDVTFDSVAYTARYVVKKQKGLMASDFLEYYDSLDPDLRPSLRLQPFVGMSLKPGIASEYWQNNKLQISSEDLVKYQKRYDLFQAKPPRYFDKLFDAEDPKGFRRVAIARRDSGIRARRYKALFYSESEESRLERERQILEDKEKRYVRTL